jgi:5,10-methylenetetrahydromethanopterin reductase
MDVSCAFATGVKTPDHIAEAEKLGFRRAWCYDSPALYSDVWMTLAISAKRTNVIGLGPAVLVPSLRHLMTNAAAISTLAALAPNRVAVAIGSGFTGRVALGQRPLPWKAVRDYVKGLRLLLGGGEVAWEGKSIKMLHLDGFAPKRPISIPIYIAVAGPRGLAVAEEIGDGILFGATAHLETDKSKPVLQMTSGTVLDPGEPPDSARALAAAGHLAALAYHSRYERGGVEQLPKGSDYAEAVDAIEPQRRHLTVHEGHLVTMNSLDRRFVTGDFLAQIGGAASPEAWRERLDTIAQRGVTEIVYQPAGPDIPRELRTFAEMAGIGRAHQ